MNTKSDLLPVLVLLAGAFAAAWVEGRDGFFLWLLGVASAFIAYRGRELLR